MIHVLVKKCLQSSMTDLFCDPPPGRPGGSASGHRHHLGHVGVGSGLVAHRQHPLHRYHGESENITHTQTGAWKKNSQWCMKSEYIQSSLGQPDHILHAPQSFKADIFENSGKTFSRKKICFPLFNCKFAFSHSVAGLLRFKIWNINTNLIKVQFQEKYFGSSIGKWRSKNPI